MRTNQTNCTKAKFDSKEKSDDNSKHFIGRIRKKNHKKKLYIKKIKKSSANDDITLSKMCKKLDLSEHSKRRSGSAPPENHEFKQTEKVVGSANKEYMADLSSQFYKMSV